MNQSNIMAIDRVCANHSCLSKFVDCSWDCMNTLVGLAAQLIVIKMPRVINIIGCDQLQYVR